jgi:hypothetical protein
MDTQGSTIQFLRNQLVWHPTIIGHDGKEMGTLELMVTGSSEEVEKTVNALLENVERHGANTNLTLSKELSKLRREASDLSQSLRQSRSTSEAVQNGQRLQSVMLLLRILESYYRFIAKRTGTSGD